MRIFRDYGQVRLFGDDGDYERKKEKVFCKLIIKNEVHGGDVQIVYLFPQQKS